MAYERLTRAQSIKREKQRNIYWHAWGLGKFGSKARGKYPGDRAKRGGWAYKSKF